MAAGLPQNMTGEASGSRQKLWANGAPSSPPQEDQGGPSEARGEQTSSQDPQPSQKGKEPERPTTSDGHLRTEMVVALSQQITRTSRRRQCRRLHPSYPHALSWEITGNDGTGDSNQQRIEKLKEDLAEERARRARLEERISQLEADVNNTKEERKRWENESITRLTPTDLLDGKNKEWQQIFDNLTKRYQESVDMKHCLEDQLEEAKKTIKRLERQIEELNERLENSQKEMGRLNAELHQRNAQSGNSEMIGVQNE